MCRIVFDQNLLIYRRNSKLLFLKKKLQIIMASFLNLKKLPKLYFHNFNLHTKTYNIIT